MIKIFYILVLTFIQGMVQSNNLMAQTNINLIVDGDVHVQLINQNGEDHVYSYLPSNLRLSKTESGQPEFLYMSYNKENTGDKEAIMHWLLTWGLTNDQLILVDSFDLLNIDSLAIIAGPAHIISNEKYEIINKGGNAQIVEALQKGLTSGGSIPTQAGGKSASSFKFKNQEFKIIEEVIKEPKKGKGIFITMGFTYTGQTFNSNGFKINSTKNIELELELNALITQAKTCNECIILAN